MQALFLCYSAVCVFFLFDYNFSRFLQTDLILGFNKMYPFLIMAKRTSMVYHGGSNTYIVSAAYHTCVEE